MMKYQFLILSLAAFALVLGCHKDETGASGQNQQSAQGDKSLPPAPSYVTANADNNVRQNATGVADPFLTTQLRAFVAKYGHVPQSFAEFANKGLDSIPRPPEGKKWAIDGATQEVKAVDK
jgi:hypothetical protein